MQLAGRWPYDSLGFYKPSPLGYANEQGVAPKTECA